MTDQRTRAALVIIAAYPFSRDHEMGAASMRKIARVALSAPRQAENAEEYLRQKYGAYRGHPEWRALEEAFLASAGAGS